MRGLQTERVFKKWNLNANLSCEYHALDVLLGHCEEHGNDNARERTLCHGSFSQVWIGRLMILQIRNHTLESSPKFKKSGP